MDVLSTEYRTKRASTSHFKIVGMLLLMLLPELGGATTELAKTMVPRGKLLESFGRDHIVKTIAGTKVQIEFKLDGKLQEATGKNLNQGDELEPGDGLISLSTAAEALMKLGTKPQGYWTLEEDKSLGWVYVLGEVVIDAKTGKVMRPNSLVTTHSKD